MSEYTQADRIMSVTTPLGENVLLLSGYAGTEQISGLFRFRIDLISTIADATQVKFENLLGQPMTLSIDVPGEGQAEEHRYVNGICVKFSEGHRDKTYCYYQAEIVPKAWTLTRIARSRIFQQTSVPDILKQVLVGFDVDFQIQGTFEPREYCVQYRETDFDFASRLMEEEGIFYFFKHEESSHKMVVTNTGLNYLDLPGVDTVNYDVAEAAESEGTHIDSWTKSQELRSGKTTLWDYNFQLPEKNLQAQRLVTDSLQSGTVTHKLKVGGNENYELYDYPGGYAKRFDGINKSGGEQASELQKVYQDNERTAGLRMEQESARALLIKGTSNCPQFLAASKFTLAEHFDGEGDYVLLKVDHKAEVSSAYRSGESNSFKYTNSFECFPAAMTFRPPHITPRPTVRGSQTAIVVGPQGEEIFTDKYGRVKVQFNWDRDGQKDANSSCWLRVASPWAGNQWGMIHIPRIGQEVLVDFLEGDPDAPIVGGSVYSPKNMPPYVLPDKKTQSGIKSRSSLQGQVANANEIRFEDKKGSEQLFINAEKDLDFRTENDARHFVGANEHVIITTDRKSQIKGKSHSSVTGDQVEKIDGKATMKVGMSRESKISMKEAVDAGTEIHLKAGTNVTIEAGTMLTLKVGGNFVVISSAGVTIQGTMVMINSGGAAGAGSGAAPADPETPDTADDGSKGTKLA